MIQVPAGLTMDTTPAQESGFCAAVAAAAKQAGGAGKFVELDCSALASGFDSSAVALLLAAARSAATNGGGVRLLNVPENLRKLASLYGVDSLLFSPAH